MSIDNKGQISQIKSQNFLIKIILLLAVSSMFLITGHGMAVSTAQDFVNEIASANELEIESSRLAIQKSRNVGIKQFAQRMVDEYEIIGNNLSAVVMEAPDVDVEMSVKNMDRKHQ